MRKISKIIFYFIVILLLSIFASENIKASGDQADRVYEGPVDPAGDYNARRTGWMTGNRVLLKFTNNAELSSWPERGSLWPNNYDGLDMLDGVGLLIGAMVYIEKDNDPLSVDSIPVTDPGEILLKSIQGKIDTLFYLQTSYREEMDTDPTGQYVWGFNPCFGYFNPDGIEETPAISDDSDSWPLDGWPGAGLTKKWQGEWNGRFGRGIDYADMETYFVLNDAQDQEYLGPEDMTKYYPNTEKYIGMYRSDVSMQKGLPWGGLGLRVEVRGFQWNNPQARDAIFWEYNIANTSDHTLNDVCFGYWVDNQIGGDGDDDLGYFEGVQDLAYSWDNNGIGAGGFKSGMMGFAYLESPGLPENGKDDDLDGLIDEKRDNEAGQLVGPEDGISDIDNFLSFYKLDREDLREHFQGDEDQDWDDGEDLNGNGVYDFGENAGDDVGLDGVGPNDLNYTGPDEGECDHMPSFREGVGCEPDFNFTDVTESDMVGLTSFKLFPIPAHRAPFTNWFRNDKSLVNIMRQDSLMTYIGNISNLVELFASGPFPLEKGRTERVSMSELHSYDPLEGLTEENGFKAPALFRQKEIVQVIYERDYRFASPPEMPTLTATAKDGKVILTWDNRSDQDTRDPFLNNVNDFEGYKLFRATDKRFQDSEVITDGYGTPMFKKPIFQCDINDGKEGFTEYGTVNGMGYYLGTDSGIKHYFIDENVLNGREYYYAIVAYDSGAPGIGPGIAPSENNIVIELDESEEIKTISQNVVVVTPHQAAAGYIDDEITMTDTSNVFGSGKIKPEIMANNALKAEHEYGVTFVVDSKKQVSNYSHGMDYYNTGIQVFDLTDSILVYEETSEKHFGTNIIFDEDLDMWYLNNLKEIKTDVFDGMRLSLSTSVIQAIYDNENSGWITGYSTGKFLQTPESKLFPWDYDIVFGDTNDILYTGRVKTRKVIDENGSWARRDIISDTDATFPFKVINKSFVDSLGLYEVLDIVFHDVNDNGKYDMSIDKAFVGPITDDGNWAGTALVLDFAGLNPEDLPKKNDEYHITYKRPFWSTDTIKFKPVINTELNEEELVETMKEIKVVPNPYVATNRLESAVSNPFLNQRREIIFTHVPAECDIKIFTSSGVPIAEIDVNNSSDDGVASWNLKSREGLEIAAGIYIFHVKSKVTGDTKMGKFAIIK